MASVFHGNWNVPNPTIGTTLATWTPGMAGTYEVDVYAYAAGTLILSDNDNIGLYINDGSSTLIGKVPLPAVANVSPERVTFFPVLNDAADFIEIKTVAASGLLSTYRGLAVGRLAIY